MSEVANRCLLLYMQSWGQGVEKRIEALNNAAAAAGLKAKFEQGPNGENAGWRGKDRDRAVAFRKEIDQCWRGSFEEEEAAIDGVIQKFKDRRDAGPAQR